MSGIPWLIEFYPQEEVMMDIPRRVRLEQNTPAELAIREAIREVELAGADVRLTDAVVLLGAALDSVADFVDGIDKRRSVVIQP